MKRKSKKNRGRKVVVDQYSSVLSEVVNLLEIARHTSARAVNTVMTATYWQIGRRIAEAEMGGQERADYGEVVITRLANDLTRRFGRGFSKSNLYQMRAFHLTYSNIFQTPSGKSDQRPRNNIFQTASGKFALEASSHELPRRRIISNDLEPAQLEVNPAVSRLLARKSDSQISQLLSARFPLPWSHYVRLLSLDNPLAREFYEIEALRGGWTVKQLHRQINTLFYERTIRSRDKLAMLTKHNRRKNEDAVSPEEEIKDPFVLEFLGLKDEYSESELEEALIKHLEMFLLELGNDFTFIGRQRRLRVGKAWYRIDLLLYHRRLRCLVIIDLKTGQFTHADAGQMHLYCNYAKDHWTHPGENPPVGLILASESDEAVAHYSLEGLSNQIVAAKYKTALPSEKLLATELKKSRKQIEAQRRLIQRPHH